MTDSMIFLINYVLLLLFSQRVSSSRQFLSLSPEKPKEFILSTKNEELKINITFLGLETVYDIRDSYTFFIPKVSVECECICTERDELYCSDRSHKRNLDCATFQNSTTMCTVYENNGVDSNVCSTFFKMCCQAYFSKSKFLESYTALLLTFNTSNYKIHVTSSKFIDNRKINFNAYNGANNFLLYLNITLEIYNNFPVNLVRDGWYYMGEYSKQLLYSPNINLKEETNLNKIGWFKNHDSELLRVPLYHLKEHLRVKPITCYSNPPAFEWKLNATYYMRNNLLFLPEDEKKVLELNENNIRRYLLYLMKEKVVFEPKTSPDLDISISRIDEIHEKSIMYKCSIIVINKSKPEIQFQFFKGRGLLRVEIISSSLANKHELYLNVINASIENPFHYTETIPFVGYNSTMICVYWGKEQLCQFPQFVNEEMQNEASIKPAFLKVNQQLINRLTVTYNNTIQPTQEEVRSTTTYDNNDTHLDGKILTISEIIILLLLLCLIAAFIYFRKWKKFWKNKTVLNYSPNIASSIFFALFISLLLNLVLSAKIFCLP